MKLTTIIKVTFFILIISACTNQDELDSPKVIGSVKHENNHSKNDDQEKKIIIDKKMLQNYVRSKLPKEKVPTAIHIVKEIPKTINNKTKRKYFVELLTNLPK